MNIGHLTDQHLDAVAEKHSAAWAEDYRRRFAEMAASVKSVPSKFDPITWETKKEITNVR